jgi:hypothetical protein
MFFVLLNNVKNPIIISNIKSSFEAFELDKKQYCYIAAEIDIEDKTYLELTFADSFIIDGRKLLDGVYDGEVIDEFALDLVELNKNLFIKAPCDNEARQKLQEYKAQIESQGNKCQLLPINLESSDMKKLTDYDIELIYELIEKTVSRMYSVREFLFRYRIDDSGQVYFVTENGEDLIADLNQHEFMEIFFTKSDIKRQRIRHAIERYKQVNCFTDKFPEASLFIGNSNLDDVQERILDYKKELFKQLSKIYPEDYIYLPLKLIEYISSKGYLPLEEIKKILNEAEYNLGD